MNSTGLWVIKQHNNNKYKINQLPYFIYYLYLGCKNIFFIICKLFLILNLPWNISIAIAVNATFILTTLSVAYRTLR